MSDNRIRNAVHALEGNYEQLGTLLACYEAWGGRTPDDIDCSRFVGPKQGDDQ